MVAKRRAISAKYKHWSEAQKLEAVSLYLTLGNLALTAATLKIPEITVRQWRATPWWKEAEAELKISDTIQFSNAAKNIIEKSMTVIHDRLERGDWIYDQKTGKMIRKPVSMKDALAATNSMIEKKLLLDKSNVSIQSNEAVEDKLNKLMDRFAAIAAGKPAIEVTDVIIVEDDKGEDNAIPEGRQEGL